MHRSRTQLLYVGFVLLWLLLLPAGCNSAGTPTATAPSPTVVGTPTLVSTVAPTPPAPEPAATIPAATEPATAAPAGVESRLTPEMLAEVDSFLSSVYQGESFQGAVLVARNGEVLLRKGVGMADQSLGIANGPETKFRLGSLTKPFTAVAVLMLYHQGVLDTGDSICLYLEKCPPAWQEITIHDLLAHTSGIVDVVTLADYPRFKTEATTPVQTIARLTDLPLEFGPGERWEYSNSKLS